MSKHTCSSCEYHPINYVGRGADDKRCKRNPHLGAEECPARTRERELLMVLEEMGTFLKSIPAHRLDVGDQVRLHSAIQKAKGK